MLTKVIIENFLSFCQKEEFDLIATKYQGLQETNVFEGVGKAALIVGPNATGKSNLILSIKKLLDMLFVDNYKSSPLELCVFSDKNIMKFEYHFKIKNSKVIYKFSIKRFGEIHQEFLEIDGVKVLERNGLTGIIMSDGNEISLNKKFSKYNLLLKIAYFNDVFVGNETIVKLLEYLKNSMYFNASEKRSISYNNITHLIQNVDSKEFEEVNNLLDELNIGFKIKKAKEQLIQSIKNNGKIEAYALKTDKPIIFFERKNMNYVIPIENESLGNQTLINLLPSFIYNQKTPSLLLIDEFSSGFHNKLEELLIQYLMKHTKNSQVIFASHSTNLLNSRILRPDQIYTVDFASTGSFIARFSDENPREAQNLEKMYLSGKFGAIPQYR